MAGSGRRRWMIPLAACLAPFVVLVALIAFVLRPAPPPRERYADVARGVPVLEDLARDRVRFLRVQDWCRAYRIDDERWSNTLLSTCVLDDDGPPAHESSTYRLFDEAAERRYTGLAERLSRFPYPVTWVRIGYTPSGAVAWAKVDIAMSFFGGSGAGAYNMLTYDPDSQLRPDRPHTRLDDDWYLVEEDWL